MAQLWRNLLPTWSILRPSWAHLRPNFAKNLHQIALKISRSAPRHRKTTKGVARGLQPKFALLRGLFKTLFFIFSCSLSFNSSWPPCLKFKARGGLARAAHWITPPPPRSGGRACVDLVSNPAKSNFPTLFKGSRGSAARAPMPTAAHVSTTPRSLFRLKLAILGDFWPS